MKFSFLIFSFIFSLTSFNKLVICGIIQKIFTKISGIEIPDNESSSYKDLDYFQCSSNKKDQIIDIMMLDISPLIFSFATDIKFTLVLNVKEDTTSAIHVDVDFYKETTLFGDIHIPCFDNKFGSCHYEFCDLVEQNMELCKKWMVDGEQKCICQIKQGLYEFEDVTINIEPTLDLNLVPQWLSSGNYRATIDVKQDDMRLACYEFHFSLM